MNFTKIAAAALFVIISACGQNKQEADNPRFSDPRVVARVGDHTLTLGEVNQKFKDKDFDSPQDEYEIKEQYVNLAVERFLHIDAAEAQGYTCPMDSSTIEGFMFQELYKRDAHINAEVSDADVRRFFDHYGGEIQYGLIIVADSALMDSIYRSLQHGSDWDSLVAAYSQVRIGKNRGGSLGYVPFWQYDDRFQLRAYDLKIGEYTEPFRFKAGWCIVKLFDRIKHSPQDLEDNWDNYRNVTSKYAELLQTEDYKRKLLDEYHYKIDWSTVDTLIHIADSVKSTGTLPDNLPGSSYLERSAFTPELLDMRIVEYDGGGVTVRDYLDLVDSYDPDRTPDLRDRYLMEMVCDEMATRRVMLDRAIALRVDTIQSYKDALQYYEENWLIQEFNKKLVSQIDTLTEDEIQTYFNEHRDEFMRPEQVRVSAIALKTEVEAQQILEKLKMGANFAALAEKYSLDKKTGAEGGDMNFFTVKRYTELFNAAEGLDIGEIGGPVEMYGDYWIFKVTQRLSEEPRPLSLALSNLKSKLYKIRREEAVRSWVRKNKKSAQYTIDLDLLRSDIGLPPGDGGQVAQQDTT